MAKYDQGGGCACGLVRVCDCKANMQADGTRARPDDPKPDWTPDWFIEKSREIVAQGGQITLPFDAGDAQVKFDSRRRLAEKIELALRQAHAKGKVE